LNPTLMRFWTTAQRYLYLLSGSSFLFLASARAQVPEIACGDNVLIGCQDSGTVNGPTSAQFGSLLSTVISTILTVFAVVAVVFVIKGGVSLIFSLGNDEKLKSARNTILYALLGLLLATLSFAIVNIVSNIRLF